VCVCALRHNLVITEDVMARGFTGSSSMTPLSERGDWWLRRFLINSSGRELLGEILI